MLSSLIDTAAGLPTRQVKKWFKGLSSRERRELELLYVYRADQGKRNKAETSALPNLNTYDRRDR